MSKPTPSHEPTAMELEHMLGPDPRFDSTFAPQLSLGPLPEDTDPVVKEKAERLLGFMASERDGALGELSQAIPHLIKLDAMIEQWQVMRQQRLDNLSRRALEILQGEWLQIPNDTVAWQLSKDGVLVSKPITLLELPTNMAEERYDLNPPSIAEPPEEHPAVQSRDQHPTTEELPSARQETAPEVLPPRADVMRRYHHEVGQLFGWLDYDIHLLCRGISGKKSLSKVETAELLQLCRDTLRQGTNEFGDNITQDVASEDQELLDGIMILQNIERIEGLERYWLEQVAPYWGKLSIVSRAVLYVRYQQRREALSGKAG